MEKPMGVTAAEVRSVADKAAAIGAFVAVPLGQRYFPAVVAARQLIAEGRLGPLSHFYFRLNRPTSARYRLGLALDARSRGGGGRLPQEPRSTRARSLLFLTGEDAQVTGAQLSWRARGQRVEDYASVLLRTPGGVLGTVEVGNGFPRNGTDGGWKIAGRDALFLVGEGRPF